MDWLYAAAAANAQRETSSVLDAADGVRIPPTLRVATVEITV
jgi:hypothetical protein